MKRCGPSRQKAGFTLVELLVGATIGAVVSLGVFAFLNTGSMLAARNLSLNLSSNSMRDSLDRVEQLIQQGDTMPTLINTSGTAATGPAAGVRFDRYVGGPYVINPPALSVASSVTSLTLVNSMNSAASPPLPTEGDVIRIDGYATLRPRIGAGPYSTSTPSLGMRAVVVPLTTTLGTTVSASTLLRARLVRDVAVIVMPSGAGRQLRYYPDIAGTSNLNDASKYKILTDQIGLETSDATPFSLVTIQNRSFVSMSLRVRASNFDNRLLGKQADRFNTFARVDSFIRPKINP
jgi:prepilin-type N-terminal cleavage/methylation domain-containing protein